MSWIPSQLPHPLTAQCHPQDHAQLLPALGSAAENPEFLLCSYLSSSEIWTFSKVTGQFIDQNDSTENVTCNNDQVKDTGEKFSPCPVFWHQNVKLGISENYHLNISKQLPLDTEATQLKINRN